MGDCILLIYEYCIVVDNMAYSTLRCGSNCSSEMAHDGMIWLVHVQKIIEMKSLSKCSSSLLVFCFPYRVIIVISLNYLLMIRSLVKLSNWLQYFC